MRKYILLGLMLLFVLFLIGCSNNEPVNYDSFAQCLTEKGAVMYGTEWCSHCNNQKDMFGDSFQYVNYVDCDKNREVCQEAGIRGYPTWNIDGEDYPGEQKLERLAALSGCKLNEDA